MEVSRFSWGTVQELRCSDRVHEGCNPAHRTREEREDDGGGGEREHGRVRAVSLLRNRDDADVSRYIPGSTTTALLSSNPEVPGPVRGGCTERHGGEENALPTAGGGRRERTGAARIQDAGQAARRQRRRWLGREEGYDRRRGGTLRGMIVDGGLASPSERPTGQFRLEPRGRRATGRLSAPFFRYSFISFRFSSSSVSID